MGRAVPGISEYKKRPETNRWPCGGTGGDAYFLALQMAQVAQVVLPSAQHFMPQAEAEALEWWEAQPAHSAAVQTIRARSLMDFIVRYFSFGRPVPGGLNDD